MLFTETPIALSSFVGLAMAAAPAQACRAPLAATSYLHETLPNVPEGAIAAEVEVLTGIRSHRHVEIDARIVSMLSGAYSGTRMRIEPTAVTSCDSMPAAGQRGIVVGTIVSATEAQLVVDPIRAPPQIELQSGDARPAREPGDDPRVEMPPSPL